MGANLNMLRQDELHRLQELQYALDQAALTALIDSRGVLTGANDNFLRVAGFSQEEICKQPFARLLTEDCRRFFDDSIMPILLRGLTWKGELCHVARNGAHFWTEASLVPILEGNHALRHAHLIANEISERKAVERALAHNAVFFTQLMDMAPIGFFLADAEGKCTYINRTWSEMTGCRLRRALGSHWMQAVFPEDRPLVQAAWNQLITAGTAMNCEFRYLHPSGKTVWVLASAERVDFSPDSRTRFIRVEKDLTERKESERVINEQRAQMVAASRMSALGEMAGGIAHEINNPLAILQLLARQIVQATQRGTLPPLERLQQTAQNIKGTTERIAAIIRSLKAIAREGHGDPFVLTPVKSLLDNVLELCRTRFISHGVTLTVRPFIESLEVECRSVEILQVLLNLLNNAFSAVETCDPKWVELSIWDLGSDVEVWVTDSGPGIPQELQSKLFQPFFTTKPVGSGTGLGLSISKAVALDHHGDLRLASESAQTRFILRLPKHQDRR